MQYNDTEKALLQRAIDLIKAGQPNQAKEIVISILKTNPQNALAWYLVSRLTDDQGKQVEALKRALKADPQLEIADKALKKIRGADAELESLFAAPSSATNSSIKKPQSAKAIPVSLWLGAIVIFGIIVIVVIAIVAPRLIPAAVLPTATPSATPTATGPQTATSTAVPTVTLTPTYLPLALIPGDGQVQATLFSAPGDSMGRGRGNFTLTGMGSLRYGGNGGIVGISITDNQSAETWAFDFYAPNYVAGQEYLNANGVPYNLKPDPAMSFSTAGFGCSQASGSFKMEQQGSDVLITFKYWCGTNAVEHLQGTLRFTPLSALTPTPTIPPDQVFQPTLGTGRVQAALYSAPADSLGSGRGNFTLTGPGNLEYKSDNGAITLTFTDSKSAEYWRFQFYAPSYMVGKEYTGALQLPNDAKSSPGLGIMAPGGSCKQMKGSFRIEQQGSDVLITFRQQCDAEGKQLLQGTLRFTPQAAITPTPTLPPEQVFQPIPALGRVRVELYSAPQEILAQGVGNFVLEGPGELSLETGGTVTFAMTPESDVNRAWSFSFLASPIELRKTYTTQTDSTGGMLSAIIVRSYLGTCTGSSGQFTVEQQQPTIIIAFSHNCNKNPNQLLKGKLTFTPSDQFTPTPTIPADKVFTPTPMDGELAVALTLSGQDGSGAARGPLKFKGPARLELDGNNDNAIALEVIREDSPDEVWKFIFFSPVWQVGVTYDPVAVWPNTTQFAGMAISNNLMNSTIYDSCQTVTGSFTVKQNKPRLVIDFKQSCAEDPTHALRGTISFTPYSAFTPTPTVNPNKLINILGGPGRIQASLVSSPQDPVGRGQGAIELDGMGGLQIDTGTIQITLADPTNQSDWNFAFRANPLQIGYPYKNVQQYASSSYTSPFPGMDVFDRLAGQCAPLVGQFTIEQQSPTLVISFTQQCNKDPNQTLRGRLTFTPISLLTPSATVSPTATVPSNKLVTLKTGSGKLNVTLSSGGGDFIGGGQGSFTLQSDARLVVENGQILTSPIDGSWRFTFYAPLLVVGQTYKGATRYPFNDRGSPAMSISSSGRECNTLMGEFTIVQQSPKLVITFVQYCEDATNPLRGTVTYTPNP